MKKWAKYCLMIGAFIVILMVINMPDLMAQGCSLCTLDAAQQGPQAAKGLNAGILYIAAVPFALIGVIGYQWYKRNGSAEGEK